MSKAEEEAATLTQGRLSSEATVHGADRASAFCSSDSSNDLAIRLEDSGFKTFHMNIIVPSGSKHPKE